MPLIAFGSNSPVTATVVAHAASNGPDYVAVDAAVDSTPPVTPQTASAGARTLNEVVTDWMGADATFGATFPGGLHYDAAPARENLVYPLVVFYRTDATMIGVLGAAYFAEMVKLTFTVWDDGDQATEIDELAATMETILFGRRGAQQDVIEYAGGRLLSRQGGIKSVQLAAGLGRGGVDLFKAEIDATFLIARDG